MIYRLISGNHLFLVFNRLVLATGYALATLNHMAQCCSVPMKLITLLVIHGMATLAGMKLQIC